MKSEEKKACIVTLHGKPKMLILPYFEHGNAVIEDYLEDYEMWKNRNKICAKLRKSIASGISDFVI
jgi:hypothetical protein